MLRGCLLSLLLYAALSVGYYLWLETVFEPPTVYWASALVGFIVLCCIGALMNARNAYRDWSLMAAARRGLPPRDGRLIAVSGTIHPIDKPLVAPFSGQQCVLCEYDLSRHTRRTDSQGRENTGSDFAGFLMTPCVIRSPGGDVKLLGFPILDGFGQSTHSTYDAARRAIDFFTTRQFEDRSGLKLVTLLAIFADVWSDEDGLVEKNVRLGKISLPDLFTPELEAEIDRRLPLEAQAKAAAAEGGVAPKDDEEPDEDDEDDLDDEAYTGGSYSAAEVPKMTEKRVGIGEEVCAIGRFNEVSGGLLPPRGSTTPNRLVRGTAEQLEQKSRGSIVSNIVGGLLFLVLTHGATFGVMKAYTHSSEMKTFRQKEGFQAVEKGDLTRLARLHRKGMPVDLRNTSEQTLLMEAKEPAVTAWLIERGADVNAVDKEGETALMKAAQAGQIEKVKQLIAAKANLNLRSTNFRRTALMVAIDSGHEDLAALLRQAGAADNVITAANGQPLPADGGPQLAACRAYLQAIRDRDPAALRDLFALDSKADFATVDWQLWQRTRPMQLEAWTGFVRGDDATLTLSGLSDAGRSVVWVYQLRRTDGQWRIARERDTER